jgi:hypothetical protein
MPSYDSSFSGIISADGSAKIEVIKRQEGYTIVGPSDYDINVNALAAVSAYFTLSQEPDGSGNAVLNVAVTDENGLRDALVSAFTSGAVTKAGEAATLLNFETTLAAVHEAAFNLSLSSNGVNQALEASVVKENKFDDFVADVSGNATSGMTKLAAEFKAASNTDALRLMALELPESNYTGQTIPPSIPYAAGDSLRIRFTVNSTFTLSNDAQDPNSGDDDVSTPDATAAPGIASSTKTYTVDLILHVPAA